VTDFASYRVVCAEEKGEIIIRTAPNLVSLSIFVKDIAKDD
jgi:hypothetical protein